jgi:hypothetical protein
LNWGTCRGLVCTETSVVGFMYEEGMALKSVPLRACGLKGVSDTLLKLRLKMNQKLRAQIYYTVCTKCMLRVTEFTLFEKFKLN